MKIKSKKILSVLLAVVIAISVIPMSAIITSAATFTPRFSAPSRTGWYASYDRNNCVMYARCRANEICGRNVNLGYFPYWYSNAQKNGTFAVGQQPKVGAIACWSGHVAVVEAINGNKITFSEGHYYTTIKSDWVDYSNTVINGGGGSAGTWFTNCTRPYYSNGRPNYLNNQTFYGYVYLVDSPQVEPPKPAAPSTPTMNNIGKTDVAQGSNVTLSWSATSNATSYILKIQSNTINQEINVGNTTSYGYNLPDAQMYTFSVKAKGDGGESSYSSTVSCTAHEPSTVTFLDWDGSELEKVEVKYGEDAKSPEIPKREGYTFSSWDSSYYNIISDKVINAVYKINTYTVNFIGFDGEILKTEKVNYGESATPPTDTKAPDGYVFQSWQNEDYKNVYVENGTTLNVNAIYNWENPDIPIVCSNATATRKDEDKGYYVYFDLKNYSNAITRGRAVVSLKTADDKLVDMSESAAFSIPAGGTKTGMEVFIPSDKAATSVEIVIVDSYSSGVPISEKVTAVVTNEDMWSDWTDTAPEDYTNDYALSEERTVYRQSEKNIKTITQKF